MTFQIHKFEKYVSLLNRFSPSDGPHPTKLENFYTYKTVTPYDKRPSVETPLIGVIGQGKKFAYLGKNKYEYSFGSVIIVFYHTPVELELVEASDAQPFLASGIEMDMNRMSDILLRMDRIDGSPNNSTVIEPSGIIALPLTELLLDLFIKLLELQSSYRDVAMLGDSVVDEIYYRLLCDEHGSHLRVLLQQKGEIQRVSRAVTYIHQNLDQPVSVENLADMVHMAPSTFYENFRKVMHMSPLQYAKSMKLHKAQMLIREGKSVSEAGYSVGYKSSKQFSREYKRQFGYVPSATAVLV